MAWYRAGSLAVTNGSAVVTGAGTAWVANVQPGHAINLPDGKAYEVLSVDSNTQITLGSPYLGASSGAQPYSVQPNQGFAQTAATALSTFLTQVSGWVVGPLAGKFPSGSVAAPSVSSADDQDTGMYWPAANTLALVAGGVPALYVVGQLIGVGTSNPLTKFHVNQTTNDPTYSTTGNNNGGALIGVNSSGAAQLLTYGSGQPIIFGSYNQGAMQAEYARIDGNGNLLVGTATGTNHWITKSGLAEGGAILQIDGGAGSAISAQFRRVNANAFNGANNAALMLGNNTTNNRSLSAGGTLNASGADYAEYLTKANGCGTIAKGDVCGVNRDGRLCRTWADAVRFVIKSTDPNLVGGDTWAAHLPARPDAPGAAPIEPTAPMPSAGQLPEQPMRGEDEDEEAFIHRRVAYLIALSAATAAATADQEAMSAYLVAASTFPAAKAEHDAAVATYETALAAWEADLEAARQTVDRIAFSGQVPVNVDADTLAACEAALVDGDAVYLIAIARGAGIGVSAVREADMTLPLYMRRVGVVWAIRDGRPWVDVQHG